MLGNPAGGLNYGIEFQTSALPFLTTSVAPVSGSPVRFDFPKVSRFIAVSNLSTGSTLSFGFTALGVMSSSCKYVLNGGQSVSFELRVAKMWLQGEDGTPPYSMCAGLTNIDASNMPVLTGTLGNGDPGWVGVG